MESRVATDADTVVALPEKATKTKRALNAIDQDAILPEAEGKRQRKKPSSLLNEVDPRECERRLGRMAKNRQSAQKSRTRKTTGGTSESTSTLRKQNEQLTRRLKETERERDELRKQVKGLETRLDELFAMQQLQQLQQAPVSTMMAPPAPPAPSMDPMAVQKPRSYQTASLASQFTQRPSASIQENPLAQYFALYGQRPSASADQKHSTPSPYHPEPAEFDMVHY